MKTLFLCIEGTKGAGKSSTIALLTKKLEARGVNVKVFAPFQAANDYAVERGFAGAWPMANASPEDNREEISYILRAMKSAEADAEKSARESGRPTVLIFDRGWATLRPHLFEGAWRRAAGTGGAIGETWKSIVDAAPPTFFLYASPDIIRARKPHLDAASGLETEEKVTADYDKRVALLGEYKGKIVRAFDTAQTPQPLVTSGIFDYVLENLGLAEKPKQAPTPDFSRYRLDEARHDEIYEKIRADLIDGHAPAGKPQAVIVAAQPGAGKSSLLKKIDLITSLKDPVIVDVDALRTYYPDYGKLCREYPFEMTEGTNHDAKRWAARLMRDAAQRKLNVVAETTLIDPVPVEATAQGFRQAGYAVTLCCIALSARESILGIFRRFEESLRAAGVTRWTDMDFHDRSYRAIPFHIERLENGRLFDGITVCRRDGTVLYNNGGAPPLRGKYVLLEERDRPWSERRKKSHAAEWRGVMQSITARTDPKPEHYVHEARERLNEARAAVGRGRKPRGSHAPS